MIVKCNCNTADKQDKASAIRWQEKTYGKGKRVGTPKANGNASCTVCGQDIPVSESK